MILLLDTDILIDVALGREPHAEDASALLDALEPRPGTAFIAWHSIANFYYLVRPSRGHGDAREFLRELTSFVRVAPTTTRHLLQACRLEMKDFEDALQVAAAFACDAGAIVSRNLRDYAKAPLPAITPARALTTLSSRG